MTVLGHIGRIPKQLITAIVNSGRGQPMLEKYGERPGVLSISHHHARGAGDERIRTGQLLFEEMDVLMVLVEDEHADDIFAGLFHDAEIGEPGGGMIFSEPVARGHPMLPFGSADW